MRFFRLSRDGVRKIRRIRIGNESAWRVPSIVWDLDDAYDNPRFRAGLLPWLHVSWYPGLRGPIRYIIAGRRGEIESWRWYRRQLGLRLAGLSEERLQAVSEIVRELQEQIRASDTSHATREER